MFEGGGGARAETGRGHGMEMAETERGWGETERWRAETERWRAMTERGHGTQYPRSGTGLGD